MTIALKTLALDASSDSCSVCVFDGANTFSLRSDVPRSHAQKMLPMIDELLSKASLKLSDLDLIALTNGPGSFTGIRIAVSVAQGLSYSAGIPSLPSSSLSSMAYAFYASSIHSESCAKTVCEGDFIIAALDARMRERYWSIFRVGASAELEEMVLPTLTPEDEFEKSCFGALEKMTDVDVTRVDVKRVYGIGDGWSSLYSQMEGLNGSVMSDRFHVTIDPTQTPSANGILAWLNARVEGTDMATQLSNLDDELCSPEDLEPLYLRNEISWKKRTRIREV